MTQLILFFEFFKVGLFCFGGAFGMIPVIKEVVLSHSWMTEPDFYGFLGVCESTPGPIAVNLATYIGLREGGFFGSVLAVSGVVLPSFIIILLIASLLKNLTDNKYFNSVMSGIRPVVAALILYTGISFLFKTVNFTLNQGPADIKCVVIVALIAAVYFFFRLVFRKKLSSVAVIVISAFIGLGVCVLSEALIN